MTILNIAHAIDCGSATGTEALVCNLAGSVEGVLVTVLPYIFSVVALVLGVMVAYRLFRRFLR